MFFFDIGRILIVIGNRFLAGIRVSVLELVILVSFRDLVDVNVCVYSFVLGFKFKGRLVIGGETGIEGKLSRRGEEGVKREVWVGGGV